MDQHHIELVRKWAATGMELTRQCEALAVLAGADYGSPLFEAIWHERDAHTAALSVLIGDDSEWLNYFEHECHFGSNPMRVTFKDGPTIELDTVDKLLEILAGQNSEKDTDRQML